MSCMVSLKRMKNLNVIIIIRYVTTLGTIIQTVKMIWRILAKNQRSISTNIIIIRKNLKMKTLMLMNQQSNL